MYSDICGLMSTQSIRGANYFILMKDDYSDHTVVYFLKHKNEIIESFKIFAQLCENKFGQRVKVLAVYSRNEYLNLSFSNFLRKKSIQLETMAPYTPQQNGGHGRDMRTSIENA